MILARFCIVATLVAVSLAQVPSYIHVCGRRNPQLNKCVQESVEALLPKLRQGIPELDVPPLDPLYVDQVDLADMPNFKASAENVTITGLSEYEVTDLKVNLEEQMFEVHLLFKKLTMKAEYDVTARILVPVAGKGPIHCTAVDVTAMSHMGWKLVNKNGKKYMFFPSMTTKLAIADYQAFFDPSEGPSSTLATAINEALSNSRQEIIASTTPNLEKAISQRVLELAGKITRHFTFEELFPDRE